MHLMSSTSHAVVVLLVLKFYYLWLQFAGQKMFAAVTTIHQSKGLVHV